MNIKLTLRGQELIADAPLLAEQTVGKLYCSIEADSEWDGLAIRLVFRNINALGQVARSEVVRDFSAVEVPPECIVPGFLFINAVGVAENGAVRLTTADMPVGLTIEKVSGMDAPTASPVMPSEYDKLLSLIGNLADVPVQDTSSVSVIVQLMLAQIGDVSKLDTEDLSSAIRAAKIHAVRAMDSGGSAYVAAGDVAEIAAESGGLHKGKGTQIIMIPDAPNNSTRPTLALNGSEPIEIRVRAAHNRSDNDNHPEATAEIPIGALMRGVPYTMTFCGKYWLIDSYIPLAACASNESEASLMREFAARAMSVSDADMIAVPVINSADELQSGSEVGLAQIVRGEGEVADPNGFMELATVSKAQEMIDACSAFIVKNGQVHTYDAQEKLPSAVTVTVGGVNADGIAWQQIERGAQMDEPYLKEWGWQCCHRESSADNRYQPMELYRWLYRCYSEGLTVVSRTIQLEDGQDVTFDTDVSKEVQAGCDDIYSSDEVYGTIVEAQGRTSLVDAVIADEEAVFMRIPVLQFGISDERQIYRVLCRVAEDNPRLCISTAMCSGDFLPVIKDNGVCKYWFSIVPTEDKRVQMLATVAGTIAELCAKVTEVCGVCPGDKLSLSQKLQVLKVIHDFLVLHGNMDGKSVGYWTPLMHSVLDDRMTGNCMGYTQAFNYVARLYGIEAIQVVGKAYLGEAEGEHAWSAVRLSDERYGSYPGDGAKWSSADVYWDEPAHQLHPSEETLQRGVSWDYFLNVKKLYSTSDNEEHRDILTEDGYGLYPFIRSDGVISVPAKHCPYAGETIYEWEDLS